MFTIQPADVKPELVEAMLTRGAVLIID